jgi:hypothetical protein
MDKKITKVIRGKRRKEWEETKKRCATYSQSVARSTFQRLVEKRHKTNFN